MIAKRTEDLFDAGTLRRFESAALLARRAARGTERGERRGLAPGSSPEFADFRHFVSGDDPRAIDWHAFARWRQLVLKIFAHEQDLPMHFLLDCSASMGTGSPPKFDLARRIVGGLAYVALGNLDRMSLTLLGSENTTVSAMRRARFSQLARTLADCPLADRPASLEEGVQRWLAGRPPRGFALVVGDGFGTALGDLPSALKRLSHAGQAIGFVHLVCGEDMDPPDFGEYELVDCETRTEKTVVVDTENRTRFLATRDRFLENLERECVRRGAPYLRVDCGQDVGGVLAKALRWQ